MTLDFRGIGFRFTLLTCDPDISFNVYPMLNRLVDYHWKKTPHGESDSLTKSY